MTIEIKKNADEVVLEVTGRLDTITAPSLEKTIIEDVGDIKNLTLDLKGLEYVSSAGLRVLLSTQKRIQRNGTMKLKNVCDEVMEVFEMTGFADILTIE
jgi:anti-sigma B factor antagonist